MSALSFCFLWVDKDEKSIALNDPYYENEDLNGFVLSLSGETPASLHLHT